MSVKRYEQLLQLPVFQGITPESVQSLIEKIPFHFIKRGVGEEVVGVGKRCSHLIFLISGRVEHRFAFEHYDLTFVQTLNSPAVLGIDTLFGPDTHYHFSAAAIEPCGLLQVPKADFITMLQKEKVILFNTLNMLSSPKQRFISTLETTRETRVEQRLHTLLKVLSLPTSSNRQMVGKMSHLSQILSTNAASLSQAIDQLVASGQIEIISPTQIHYLNS